VTIVKGLKIAKIRCIARRRRTKTRTRIIITTTRRSTKMRQKDVLQAAV
jgi:hypothetical protein